MTNRYKLYADKIINMITHSSQRGRRLVLWLQSIVSPLQTVNDEFQTFTNEKIIEAHVTSQVLHLTWFLNFKFKQYFVDQNDAIKILHYVDFGVQLFSDGELSELPNTTFSTTETWDSEAEDEQPQGLYFEFEGLDAIGASFKVTVPDINIEEDAFETLIRAEIERYRVSGKTYTLEYTI